MDVLTRVVGKGRVVEHDSLQGLDKWKAELDQHGGPNVVKLCVGNKTDLRHVRTVTELEGRKYAEDAGMKFMETSALDATNVEEAFTSLIHEVYDRLPQAKPRPSVDLQPAIPVNFHYEEPRGWCPKMACQTL